MDGQTDGQQDDANSRSYCVAVRSAKNVEIEVKKSFKTYKNMTNLEKKRLNTKRSTSCSQYGAICTL